MDVIYIIERDKDALALLERTLDERGVTACTVVDTMPADGLILDIEKDMGKPYRFGALLDRIKNMRDQDVNPQILHFDCCDLDTVYCLFYAGDDLEKSDGQGIRLTEKETEILTYLAMHSRDVPVKRDDLLAAIWGYAEDIETHTLETHIYRLRQKIEDNPSEPVFLITSDEGYRFPGP